MAIALKGRTVVVVGGSSGMGLAVARKAAAEGALVHAVGRSGDRLLAAKATIAGEVTLHEVDICHEAEVAALAVNIGPIDHLIITAANNVFKPFVDITTSDIEAMLWTKLWGAVHLVRHFASRLAADGSITLFGGVAAHRASPGASIVAALNASMEGLSRTLALELAPIRVNTLAPGVVDTPAWDFLPKADRSHTMAIMGSSLPVGRVGRSDDLADAALFLMTNGFTTGTVLHVDGGANA
ncbi:SDR family oxidoreductase [Dyella sp. ASV21]|uniref:SDR family oxidoreductase n=1 Tax=Dyella sp. ASV21 TaxID=2795114 RepID=UPI0018EC3966|nr:SDR family oxidoreductase [Dyella sp. ASV21]